MRKQYEQKMDIRGGESLEFKSFEEAEEWMLRDRVNRLRARGASDEMIFAIEESWLRNNKDEISDLDAWLSRYDGEVFDPPVVFDATDEHAPDFSTPIQSLRSYWTAMHFGDAKTLLANADRSALKVLRSHFGVNETQEKDT
ncbi:MAG: hypothetical protein LAT83_21110 [Kiritimatiellae bacterium]|nr:hypothetical protein [Kiritimatiellia bacterium]